MQVREMDLWATDPQESEIEGPVVQIVFSGVAQVDSEFVNLISRGGAPAPPEHHQRRLLVQWDPSNSDSLGSNTQENLLFSEFPRPFRELSFFERGLRPAPSGGQYSGHGWADLGLLGVDVS